jgi:hypothetical protein
MAFNALFRVHGWNRSMRRDVFDDRSYSSYRYCDVLVARANDRKQETTSQIAKITKATSADLQASSVLPTVYKVATMRYQLLLVFLAAPCGAFQPRPLPSRPSSPSHLFAYGRGAEIWPPSNDQAVRLADSFPNNELPPQVEAILLSQENSSDDIPIMEPRSSSWKRPLSKILRRAAARAQKESTLLADGSSSASATSSSTTPRPSSDKTPTLIALALVVYLKPLDALLAVFLTGYIGVLWQASRQPRSTTNDTPTLPALPPQGHVPYLVSHPLGFRFTYSTSYDRWLRVGVLLGLVAPVVVTAYYTVRQQFAAASLVARPLFFLCLQAVAELKLAGGLMAPLPLRILTSVAYNVLRLGYLWQWAMTTTITGVPMSLGGPGRVLAVLNLVYWTTNLFGFLIPVGVMR